MYTTSVRYSQIYPSLLPGRQFPNSAGVWPAGRTVGSTGVMEALLPLQGRTPSIPILS
jgi:hypothetical protein